MIICNCLPGMPKSDSHPAWRLRRFFISSVEDAVLERSAALESHCYGIGFGRLGRRPLFSCFTFICYVLVVVLPLGGRDSYFPMGGTVILRCSGFDILTAWDSNGRLSCCYPAWPYAVTSACTPPVWHTVPTTSAISTRKDG